MRQCAGPIMKFIQAIIRPQKLDDVRQALGELGVAGMTVSDVRGYGRQKGRSEIYRGSEYAVDFIPKVKIEIAVAEDVAEKAVEMICQAANTGSIGDGKVFVLDLASVVRVRTGELNGDAL